jgi:hypothetical protein
VMRIKKSEKLMKAAEAIDVRIFKGWRHCYLKKKSNLGAF